MIFLILSSGCTLLHDPLVGTWGSDSYQGTIAFAQDGSCFVDHIGMCEWKKITENQYQATVTAQILFGTVSGVVSIQYYPESDTIKMYIGPKYFGELRRIKEISSQPLVPTSNSPTPSQIQPTISMARTTSLGNQIIIDQDYQVTTWTHGFEITNVDEGRYNVFITTIDPRCDVKAYVEYDTPNSNDVFTINLGTADSSTNINLDFTIPAMGHGIVYYQKLTPGRDITCTGHMTVKKL